MKHNLHICWLTVFVLLLGSCASYDGECHEELKTALGCELYATSYNPIEETYLPEKVSTAITAYGVGSDSLLYDNRTTNRLAFPLNSFDTICRFVICRDSLINDTLEVVYTVSNQVVSLECGCKAEFEIRSFSHTTNAIDSIISLSNKVFDLDASHLRIYFQPQQ